MVFYRNILVILCAALTGCFAKQAQEAPILVLSILPQRWFVQNIADDTVQTVVLVGSSQNPHDYEPTPFQLSTLARAKVWVLSGTEFERGLKPKVEQLFPRLRIIDGTVGVHFRTLETDGSGNGRHESIDRHSWLGEEPALIMAAHIKDALCFVNEQHAEQYLKGYQQVQAEIRAEFALWREKLAGFAGTTVFVYHPAFGYFLDAFGIKQEAVETGGKEPTPRHLVALIEKARQRQVRTIFVQAQFPVEAAGTVASVIGARLVALDPLDPDWLGTIRKMGEAVQAAQEHTAVY
ncbi:MAG: zinc ABC transporter substrate-binding protein [Spirochaetaceae bacterium]|jgi:zinc transport system substrate-binding protein|nr:zinc ABC transporter substrate-binding protein [Spirochaetaceae bacterium]